MKFRSRIYTIGTKVHKISYIGQRRRKSKCQKVWYNDWPAQPRGTLAWSKTTCGNCLKGRPAAC